MVSWLSSNIGVRMIVVKIGGSIVEKSDALISEISQLSGGVVVVHGEGPQTTKLQLALGRAPEYIFSPGGFKTRRTDVDTMSDLIMASSSVNSQLVMRLRKAGSEAVGLSGISGILFGKRKLLVSHKDGKDKIIRDDYSGKLTKVGVELLKNLVSTGITPVVTPIALGEEFEALNVDADRAAAAVASAIGADSLLLLTDVEGYYSDFPNNLVSVASYSDIEAFKRKASAGMKRKLVATGEALDGGISEVIICSGLGMTPIASAASGSGTHFRK